MVFFPENVFCLIISYTNDKLIITRNRLWRSIKVVDNNQWSTPYESPHFYVTIQNHVLPSCIKWISYDSRYRDGIIVYPRLIKFGVSTYDLVNKN